MTVDFDHRHDELSGKKKLLKLHSRGSMGGRVSCIDEGHAFTARNGRKHRAISYIECISEE